MKTGVGTFRKTFPFRLIYIGLDDLTEELADAIFEAGCDDALLGISNCQIFLDFSREAPSFREALISAIDDVERAKQPIRLVRVEPS